MERVLVVVPARYGSSRFPGKPLHMIAGKPLLAWVGDVAEQAVHLLRAGGIDAAWCIATDDARIANLGHERGYRVVMTPTECVTGSDRAYHAALAWDKGSLPEMILNIQGDAPLTEPAWLVAVVETLIASRADIATPVIQLPWAALDTFRASKQKTPFSGTTAIMDAAHRARWFSKQILPAIREESALRAHSALSPVFVHVGLYGYHTEALKRYVHFPVTAHETYEGLEQLRALEHGLSVQCVPLTAPSDGWIPRGVDTPYDAELVAPTLAQKAAHGLTLESLA